MGLANSGGPKKTCIRICVDMRAANQAIERERHPVPTVEDLIVDLNGATVFSKIDVNQGYRQLELEENCQSINTFTTCVGLFCYKLLSFGVNSAAEIFQKSIEVLQGIEGVRNISNDIIVFGKSQTDHDNALQAVLQGMRENNLTANPDKCLFNQSFLQTASVQITRKFPSLINASPPRNATEANSFLGLVQYLICFITDFASSSAPLRQLTHQNTECVWGP